MPMRSPLRFALLLLAVLLFLAGPSLVRFYTDWLWFGEVGYQRVFLTMLQSQGTLFTITFVLATAWLALNLNVALKAIGNVRPVFTTRDGSQVTLHCLLDLSGIWHQRWSCLPLDIETIRVASLSHQ